MTSDDQTVTAVANPRNSKFRRVAAGSLLGLTLFASACTNSEPDVNADNFSSPIDEYLGTDLYGNNFDFTQTDFSEQQRAAEEAIASCMKEQGFEYVPVDNSEFNNFLEVEPGIEWGTDAYFEKYGFGISTQRFSQSQVGPELLGSRDFDFAAMEQNDPNQAAYEAMDEATQQAYDEALWGADSFGEFDETMTDEEIDAQFGSFESSGCQGKAWEGGADRAFYEEFGDEMQDLEENLLDDPKVVKFVDEVKTCAAKDGFTLPDDYPEMESYLKSELESLDPNGGEGMFATAPDISEEEFEAMTEEETQAFFAELNKPTELSDEAKAKLAEMQRDEVALWKKTSECGGDFNSLMDLYAQVMQEYQERFVETNKARLDDFKASQGS